MTLRNVGLGLTTIAAILTIAFQISSFLHKPNLAYEDVDYSLGGQQFLILLAIKNEGLAAAKDVGISMKTEGEIENVVVEIGRMGGEISESERFKDPYGTTIKVDEDRRFYSIGLGMIPPGMKYQVVAIVKTTGARKPLVFSSDGVVPRYTPSSLVLAQWGLGLIAGVWLGAVAVYVWRRRKN